MNSIELPMIGFGTYTLRGTPGKQAIVSAIQQGYRLIDSAYNYENEGTLGAAIRDAGIPREELIVTSKLPGRYQQHDDALIAIEESLWRAGLTYFDLYLIHWPNPRQGHYVEAWKTLIEARTKGLIKHIGVCNFQPQHLEKLKMETGELPEVNQIEIHPYFNQQALIDVNHSLGITTEAWSPLGRGRSLLTEPLLVTLAKKYQVSVGQLILRWHTQRGVIPIPKSANPERQKDNLNIFSFSIDPQDITAIDGLTKADGRLQNQDPDTYEEF